MDERHPRRWWPDIVLLAAFVGLTAALASGLLLDVDVAIRDWCANHRPLPAYWVARTFNYLGQGGVLTLLAIALAVGVGLRAKTVRPLFLVAAAFVLTTGVTLPLKVWTARPAPRSPLPHPEELFQHVPAGEYAESYPAGHLIVGIVWYGVLLFLLPVALSLRTRWVIRIVPVAILFVTTIYLTFHWFTDDVAGVLLGVVLWRLLARVPWNALPPPRWLGRWAGPMP